MDKNILRRNKERLNKLMKTKAIIISLIVLMVSGCSDVLQGTNSMFSGVNSGAGGFPQWGAGNNAAQQQGRVIYAQAGETLAQTALRHGIDPQSLALANNMSSQTVLRANQQLVIPASNVQGQFANNQMNQGWEVANNDQNSSNDLPTVTDPRPPQQSWNTGAGVTKPTSSSTSAATVTSAPKTSTTAVQAQPVASKPKADYSWPLQGQVIKNYSSSDPALVISAPPATPVRAAQSGKVIHAGTLTKYGKSVLVEHDDGMISIYGYNDSLLVNKGDRVSKGQTLSRVGSTGVATSPSLRFEMIKKPENKPVNPNDYLQ